VGMAIQYLEHRIPLVFSARDPGLSLSKL
jgi:hypothetical protein